MTSTDTFTVETASDFGTYQPSVVSILRGARSRVRKSAALVRDLLEALEILDQALSAKIQGKKIDEDAIHEIEHLRSDCAFSYSHAALNCDGEGMLGSAFASGELDSGLRALAYDGTGNPPILDEDPNYPTEDFGLNELLPTVCRRELKAMQIEHNGDF